MVTKIHLVESHGWEVQIYTSVPAVHHSEASLCGNYIVKHM